MPIFKTDSHSEKTVKEKNMPSVDMNTLSSLDKKVKVDLNGIREYFGLNKREWSDEKVRRFAEMMHDVFFNDKKFENLLAKPFEDAKMEGLAKDARTGRQKDNKLMTQLIAISFLRESKVPAAYALLKRLDKYSPGSATKMLKQIEKKLQDMPEDSRKKFLTAVEREEEKMKKLLDI